MSPATPDDSRPVSERVIGAVAAAADTDPAELDPLYDVVDPDALDALFDDASPETPRTTGQVILRVADHRVVVGADGSVEVDGGNGTGNAPDDTAGDSDDGETSLGER